MTIWVPLELLPDYRTKQNDGRKVEENGASTSDHETLLESKRIEVLAAMEAAEISLDIVIEKSDPTEPGPVVVLDRKVN